MHSTASDAYARYGPALLRKAERVLHSQDDAMDVVHQLFTDLLSKPTTNLELPYLYRAVTNRCLNLIRDRKNRARLLEARDVEGESYRTRIESVVIDHDLLLRLIAQLDRRSQEIVVYHFVDDMSQDEVAAMMGISRRAVVKRLGKIRERARRIGGSSSGSMEVQA
jgi:RNA polymerase sigma-70 factor (ECF subfamily)